VDLDLLGLEAENLSGYELVDALELAARPNLRAVGVNFHDAIQRLYWGVG
jgi:hypothetical protein